MPGNNPVVLFDVPVVDTYIFMSSSRTYVFHVKTVVP
jgi:hypothetical protein